MVKWTPFLALLVDLKDVVYTSNPIKLLHRRMREVIKTRRAFRLAQVRLNVLLLAGSNTRNHWVCPSQCCLQAGVQLAIFCSFTDEAII